MASRKITCLITGKNYTYGQDYYDKKTVDYIDENNLKKYFITQKAKNYLNKGYSIQEIRNILNVNDEELPGVDSQEIGDLINFIRFKQLKQLRKFQIL